MLSILITRPVAQNKSLISKISELNYQALVLPTLEIIENQNLNTLNINNLKSLLNKIDLLIIVTQNAIWALPESVSNCLAAYSQKIPVISMGEATTQAAIQRGWVIYDTPILAATSEALLEKINSNSIHNFKKSVLILKGEGGRDFLKTGLQERGAEVEELYSYKRACPYYTDEKLELIFQPWLNLELDWAPSSILKNRCINRRILVSSNESLDNLLTIMGRFSRFDLKKALSLEKIKLIVPSIRVEKQAASLGFEHIIVAASASNQDMWDAAVSCGK